MWQCNSHLCLWVLIIASVTSCWRRSLRHVYARCTFYRFVCVALLCAVSSPCNSHLCIWVLIMASVTSCWRRVLRYLRVKYLFDGYVCCIYMRFRNFVESPYLNVLVLATIYYRSVANTLSWCRVGVHCDALGLAAARPVWQLSYVVMLVYIL